MKSKNNESWIYLERVEIVDTEVTQGIVEEFAQGKNHRLGFQIDSNSEKMKSRIKIFGYTKKFIGENKYFLGFMPKEVTKTILAGDFFNCVKPSPPSFSRNGRIYFDLQGSIEGEKKFKFLFEQVLLEEGFIR